jgi:hypothetical protein
MRTSLSHDTGMIMVFKLIHAAQTSGAGSMDKINCHR